MKNSSIARINLNIVALCIAALLTASMIGLVPDERAYLAESRQKLADSFASVLGYFAAEARDDLTGEQLARFAAENPELISAGVRLDSGEYLAEIGHHRISWAAAMDQRSDGCFSVAIGSPGEAITGATLELQFPPIYHGTQQFFSRTLLKLYAVVGIVFGIACWFQLRQMLRCLNPTHSVPMRVRQTLDNFAEGVVILDTEDHMVLVNQKFARDVRRTQEELLGMKLWDLPWQMSELDQRGEGESLAGTFHGTRMQLADPEGKILAIFSVNSSPVLDDSGKYRGVMMAMTDITPMEMNRAALVNTLEDLSRTKQEITDQNEKLSFLATRDPLTGCVNRRTFFEQFEGHWRNAEEQDVPLGGMMVDIDFFKPINDNYGHSAGDEVLRQTGKLLMETARENDVVCRYGGEEFAILVPGCELDEVEAIAERIRKGLAEMKFEQFSITASIGVSAFSLGGESPQDMLDQADKCLYVAKRNGRDQVVRFDTVPEDLIVDESKISRDRPTELLSEHQPTIPYSAVTALVTALTYRDQQTGLHSRRVSGYAALLAQRLLSPSEVYVIEMAALLHDIGKIGIADSILLKPGPLDAAEWAQMEKHDRIGVEILNKSFKHEGLTDIVRYHHNRFGGICGDEQEFMGKEIPIGSRILMIVDAFDAMVSERPYRSGMSEQEAIAELQKNAGTQFDPDLVELFVSIIESGIHRTNMIGAADSANDQLLHIGEQIERLVDAADSGDGKTFIALAERLRGTAERSNAPEIAEAASHAIAAVSEDDALESLVEESFGLLNACRMMRTRTLDKTDSSACSDAAQPTETGPSTEQAVQTGGPTTG